MNVTIDFSEVGVMTVAATTGGASTETLHLGELVRAGQDNATINKDNSAFLYRSDTHTVSIYFSDRYEYTVDIRDITSPVYATTQALIDAITAAVALMYAGGGGGSGTVIHIGIAGGTTGLIFTPASTSTSADFVMSGTLDVDNGGTGATTDVNARLNLNAARNLGDYAPGLVVNGFDLVSHDNILYESVSVQFTTTNWGTDAANFTAIAVSPTYVAALTVATYQNVNQVAHGFSVENVLKRASGSYALAQADSAANAEVSGIVSAVVDADNFTLLTEGAITGLSGLTDGTTYFLSPTTAGLLTATEPSTVGQVSKPLLIANSTTSGVFANMRGMLITAPPAPETLNFFTGNVVVSGAGTSAVNGVYLPDGVSGGTVRWTKQGGVTDDDSIKFTTSWFIRSANDDQYSGGGGFFSSNPAFEPAWGTESGVGPVPLVSYIPNP